MTFQKGHSGNAKGRPKGALNKRTQALRLLIEGEAEALVRKAIEQAKAGDLQALKLCLERILPPVKELPIRLELPELGDHAAAVITLSRGILIAVIRGDLTPSEGETLMGMLETYGRAIDLRDLEGRIVTLEDAIKQPRSHTP